MTKWEYKVLKAQVTGKNITSSELEDYINRMGQVGWELVSVTPYHTVVTQWMPKQVWKSNLCTFVFKRPWKEVQV